MSSSSNGMAMNEMSPPVAAIKESDSPGGDESNGNGQGSGGSPDKPQKPHKPLNRVPRACNACRKQKMKCTDADNPPCKRCRTTGIECVFEKPIRDTLNNSEQGLWRIRNLETQVTSIQSTLAELVHTLRAAVPQASMPSPSSHASSSGTHPPLSGQTHPTPPQPQHPSPMGYGAPSPSLSANSGGPTSVYPNGNADPSGLPSQNGPQAPVVFQGASGPRGYRSQSSSSGRTVGYQSSPGGHVTHVSPPMPMSGPPQQTNADSLYRSASDPMQYPDQRQLDNYNPAQAAFHPPMVHPQHPPHTPSHFPNHHGPGPNGVMPPPTSLPPFSALDVHPTAPRPTVHIPAAGTRQPFVTPLSPRKAAMTSPTTTYNGGYASSSGSHNYSPHSAINATGPNVYPSSVMHYPDSHGVEGHSKQLTDPLSSSNVTSADSSDDEEPPSELPTSGMVAPFVVIRGLADKAEENGGESDPPTRSGSPSRSSGHTDGYESPHVHPHGGGVTHGSDRHRETKGGKRGLGKSGDSADRPPKRRRKHPNPHTDGAVETPARAVPDVVSKGIINEEEARELFNIFFTGCSMFLPVFDANTDTYDTLHKRSPFCVDAICMVAAKVRDGGGPPSEAYKNCLKEVHHITCATLFAPVARQEVVQAMILVAGWGAGPNDSGWLTCGHATRMALELGMHKAWPKLLKRMHARKAGTSQEERELVISARTWFCLYLFEHQMSFGTGRPAVLKEDESVHECRLLLTHPLAIQDDMRLVSMVELMIIRERTQNQISPNENTPIDENTFRILAQSRSNFQGWLHIWSNNFSKRYEAAAFHRQSLEAQVAFAELYHNAIALRTVRGPDDISKMKEEQRELALRSMEVAQNALHVCLRSPSYREGMKYAVQYTHLSATFTASFLMRLARLFPDDCDLPTILTDVEQLVEILSEIPATRFARTLKLMLRSAKKRKVLPSHRSNSDQGSVRSQTTPTATVPPHGAHTQVPMGPVMMNQHHQAHPYGFDQLDQFVRDVEMMSGQDNIPVWLSESNLGDLALSQQGLEAFLIPPSLDDPHVSTQEIW